MAGLSVVINAQDVAEDLPQAIASVKKIADEIVVVDQDSTDNTPEIAKKLGAKVYKHEKVTHVEKARNFAISKASNEWVLILDPDEEIPPKLAGEILKIIKDPKADYYRIPRKNIIFAKWIKNSRWWPDYNIRLFKKGFVSWNEIIHAVPMTQGVGQDLDANEELAIVHHNYATVDEYIVRMNRYTSLQAEARLTEGYKFDWRDILTKPSNEFLSRYFFGEGYRDGLHGLALSLLQAVSEFLVFLKVWQLEKFAQKEVNLSDLVKVMRDQEKDLHFWQNDTLYKQSGNLSARIKRKFRL